MNTPDPAVLTALASPRRREILRLLWDREQPAGAIREAMPDVTFGAVSLQLRVLSEAGRSRPAPKGANGSTRSSASAWATWAASSNRCGPTPCGS